MHTCMSCVTASAEAIRHDTAALPSNTRRMGLGTKYLGE